MQTLRDFVEQLPPDLQQQVRDFAEFLLEKRQRTSKGKLRFDWAGTLKDMRDQYTSTELQHKIADWRIAEQ